MQDKIDKIKAEIDSYIELKLQAEIDRDFKQRTYYMNVCIGLEKALEILEE